MPQNWHAFTAEEHRVWDLLFARQQERLAGRAVRAFMEGLDLLRLSRPGIPNLAELNRTLKARTGWPRPGRRLLPSPQRTPLYRRQLHRRADQLDYLEEPDVFHDLFGHVPLLADPRMADFMVTLGRLGLRARAEGTLERLARLYWHTVEFGLAWEDGALKIYGAGIASSFGETAYALESAEPDRPAFDVAHAMATPYRSDTLQERYFVVDDLSALLAVTEGDLERLL
ncbi:phenylalanine 4-monooxygenase [Allosphingosinicella sp.]|uniref:phenylalanine 4-monooxygenase n=1 Tax=Allosphingosinicella sp. TaxID=2823234 RepID=UPI002FC0CE68